MITLTIILLAVCLLVLAVLAITGLLAIAWPVALILAVGVLIDCLVLRALIKK